jgi:hypothetical protein
MNQHPRAKEMGITAGKMKFHASKHDDGRNNGSVFYEQREGQAYCVCKAPQYENKNKWMANAKVMADSLNVMNQTGRTPSELVELVRELRYYVEKHDQWNHVAIPRIRKELLEKTGDFT